MIHKVYYFTTGYVGSTGIKESSSQDIGNYKDLNFTKISYNVQTDPLSIVV
jgi:hypothetical protein